MNPELESFVYDLAWKLKRAGIEASRLEARMLTAHVLGIDYRQLSSCETELDDIQKFELENLVAERLTHKPLDKVLGYKGFYKYRFEVSPSVLSPRPDTEILVEAAIQYINDTQSASVLDLGTGSGCILLSILADCPNVKGIGFDKSGEALEIAVRNAYDLEVSDRVKFLQGTWYNDRLGQDLGQTFDVVVSNPPYIKSAEINQLEPEVRDYDPRTALDGGNDGLHDYRQLARVVPQLISEGGALFLEIGEGQADDVVKIFQSAGLVLLQIVKDLSGTDRCIILKK